MNCRQTYARIAFKKKQDLIIVLVDHLLNIVKELKNLEKQEVSNIYIEINQTKLVLLINAAYSDSKDLSKKYFR